MQTNISSIYVCKVDVYIQCIIYYLQQSIEDFLVRNTGRLASRKTRSYLQPWWYSIGRMVFKGWIMKENDTRMLRINITLSRTTNQFSLNCIYNLILTQLETISNFNIFLYIYSSWVWRWILIFLNLFFSVINVHRLIRS